MIHDLAASDSAMAFSDFGETVTVKPAGGGEFVVTGIVRRTSAAVRRDVQDMLSDSIAVYVRRSADPTVGVTSVERGDVVSVAWPTRSDPAADCRVVAVDADVRSDGFIRLEVVR
jgi:hypothetical protein